MGGQTEAAGKSRKEVAGNFFFEGLHNNKWKWPLLDLGKTLNTPGVRYGRVKFFFFS